MVIAKRLGPTHGDCKKAWVPPIVIAKRLGPTHGNCKKFFFKVTSTSQCTAAQCRAEQDSLVTRLVLAFIFNKECTTLLVLGKFLQDNTNAVSP